MKLSHVLWEIILVSIVCLLLCGSASANAFSEWSTYGDAWKANNDTYTIIKWNTTGTHEWLTTDNTTSIDYLVVAGGGSGGGSDSDAAAGGGGAGGLLTGTGLAVSGTETIIVGAGGASATNGANKGSNSSLTNDATTIESNGGGYGAYYVAGWNAPLTGGSSGGAGNGASVAPTPASGQGYTGGTGAGDDTAGGGGGGASHVGYDYSGSYAGDGGNGTISYITGTATIYAAGGGGGAYNTGKGGFGGSLGVGGHGGGGGTGSTAGTKNTGSGGGGQTTSASGAGGSGIVIIKYQTPVTGPVSSFISTNISITTNSTSEGWSGVTPFTMQFTNTSTNTPQISWVWNLTNVTGNNLPYTFNSSTFYNPIYTFNTAGNFTIVLNVTSATGTDISDQVTWVNVSFGGPAISFTTNVTSGVNNLALYLNDTSTRSPTYWNTSWGDLSWTNQTTFPAINITHVYSTAGTYWINEYATNPYGTANGTPLLITVYGAANSQFSAFNTAGTAPFTTYLYDTSTNITPGTDTYYWMFGDSNVSTSQYLYYTWNITGTYSVNHSFSNGLSTSWNNKSAYVIVGNPVIAPVASFYGGPQIGAPPMLVYLTDVSTHTPTSWNWSFGDGLYSVSQNPSHWYNSSGFFTVNLTATNGAGSDTLSQTNFVMVY